MCRTGTVLGSLLGDGEAAAWAAVLAQLSETGVLRGSEARIVFFSFNITGAVVHCIILLLFIVFLLMNAQLSSVDHA